MSHIKPPLPRHMSNQPPHLTLLAKICEIWTNLNSRKNPLEKWGFDILTDLDSGTKNEKKPSTTTSSPSPKIYDFEILIVLGLGKKVGKKLEKPPT